MLVEINCQTAPAEKKKLGAPCMNHLNLQTVFVGIITDQIRHAHNAIDNSLVCFVLL